MVAIADFNRVVAADLRVEQQVMLLVRDGLTIIRRAPPEQQSFSSLPPPHLPFPAYDTAIYTA